ncbi:MAG: ABC transporter substrate-binding protein [Propionicimonas sp.]|uniref:ABC transporter substrate-binding protein n=1 Tax=Propionicimonas sp. TaxID=1955623 RepID=UPI003D1129A5
MAFMGKSWTALGRRTAAVVALSLFASLGLSACSSTGGSAASGASSTVTIGYFPNLTHAPALVGVSKGYFAKALGDGVELKTATFNAGPAALEALNAGSLDIAFIGPNPTITGYTQSKGQSLRVIAGAAANGASLVVSKDITSVEQLKGAKIASPQLGNTQDVALRYWLKEQGFETTTEGGGDVSIMPQENATALQSFTSGDIAGAWVPEPWATRLVNAGGHVLVNEADLWPNKQFIVTNVIVRTQFLTDHPDEVKEVLSGLLDSLDYIKQNPDDAKKTVNDALADLTGKGLDEAVLDTAWKNVVFTYDPLSSTLKSGADHAVAVGLLEQPDLSGLYSLDTLNALLKERGEQEVSDS